MLSAIPTGNLDRFSPSARQVFSEAEAYAKTFRHFTIGPQHVFITLFTNYGIGYDLVTGIGLDGHAVILQLMSNYPDCSPSNVQPKLSTALKATIAQAVNEARYLNHTQITTGHLLMSMFRINDTWVRETFKSTALSHLVLLALIQQALLLTKGTNDDPLPTETKREQLETHKKVDKATVVPTPLEKMIRWTKGATGLPPLEPRPSFTMIDYLTVCINVLPDCAALYTYRAFCLVQLGKYVQAALDCSQAIRLRPTFAAAYLARGIAYLCTHDVDRSLKDLDQALRYAPQSWHAYLNRAYVWVEKNQLDNAFADFNETLKLLPHLPAAFAGRGQVRLLKREFHWAIADYDQALRYYSGNYTDYHNRGTAKAHQGDFDGAQKDFEAVLRLNPRGSYSYSNLGWLALLRGQYDKVDQYCKRAIEIDPHNGAAYYSRGAAKAAMNNITGAVSDFKRSLKLWTTVDNQLTAHIGKEMRDFLAQHDHNISIGNSPSEANSDGE